MNTSLGEWLDHIIRQVKEKILPFFEDLNKQSIISLLEGLKSNDDIAVGEILEYLKSEPLAVAIPPVYLAKEKHPNSLVRRQCEKFLSESPESATIRQLTTQKNLEQALEALIQHYGHFRTD